MCDYVVVECGHRLGTLEIEREDLRFHLPANESARSSTFSRAWSRWSLSWPLIHFLRYKSRTRREQICGFLRLAQQHPRSFHWYKIIERKFPKQVPTICCLILERFREIWVRRRELTEMRNQSRKKNCQRWETTKKYNVPDAAGSLGTVESSTFHSYRPTTIVNVHEQT